MKKNTKKDPKRVFLTDSRHICLKMMRAFEDLKPAEYHRQRHNLLTVVDKFFNETWAPIIKAEENVLKLLRK